MALLVTNNANTTLAADISDSASSISVATGTGALFPSPTGSDYALVTLDDGTNVEIVKCTARSGDTLTVTRAQESTTAKAFASGTVVALRLTAGGFATKSDVGHTHVAANISDSTTTGSEVQRGDGSGGLTAITELHLPESTASTPATGLNLGAETLGKNPSLRMVNPDGRSIFVQEDILRAGYGYLKPNWGSGWARMGFNADPTTANVSIDTVSSAPTNALRRMPVCRMASGTTPGTVALIRGTHTSSNDCFYMRSSGVGRWKFRMLFSPCLHTATVSDARGFWGVKSSSTNPTNVAATTLLECMGVGLVEGSANLYAIHADGSNNDATDLGSNFPSQDLNSQVYYLLDIEQAADGHVYGTLINLYSGARTTWDWSTLLPTTYLTLWMYCTNNASSSAVTSAYYGAEWWSFA